MDGGVHAMLGGWGGLGGDGGGGGGHDLWCGGYVM